MDDPVYWRIYRRDDGTIGFPCMQWFDEYDYRQERFLDDGQYPSEVAAREAYDRMVVDAMKLLGLWPPKVALP